MKNTLFVLVNAVKIPKRDKRQKRSWLSYEEIPAGTHFIAAKAKKMKGEKEHMYLEVDPPDHGDRMTVFYAPNYSENEDLGPPLMANAVIVTEGFRAEYLRAVGDDPYAKHGGYSAQRLLERLWDAKFLSERQLRQVAHSSPCPHRSDVGYPCALWEGHPPAMGYNAEGEEVQLTESGCDFS